MSRRYRFPLGGPLVLFGVLVLVSLAACSVTTGTGSTATPTSTGSPGATAGTPTSSTCTQALPGAGPATAGPSFTDLALPTGAVGTTPTKALGGGDGEFTVWNLALCSTGATVAGVQSAFGALTAQGWLTSDWFPADSEAESSCIGQQPCWAKDTRYVMLSQVTDAGGGGVTYSLRLATPPPAPDCSAGYNGLAFPPGYYYFLFSQQAYPGVTDGFDHIALPPLTQLAMDAAAGNRYAALCSAGSAAMVKAFLDKHLRAVGWVAEGNSLYKYANKFELDIMDGNGAQVKALLHWPNPNNYGP